MDALATALDQGVEALAHDELDRAELAFRSALSLDPTNLVAAQAMREIAALRNAPRLEVVEIAPAPLALDRIVRLNVKLSRLLEDDVSVREAFVVSRLVGGPLPVGDLLYICEPPQDEVLAIIADALDRGFLAFA